MAVALDASSFGGVTAQLRGLAAVGHRVVLMWAEGEPPGEMETYKARLPLTPVTVRSAPRAVLRQMRRHGPLAWRAERSTLRGLIAADARMRRELSGATGVLLVGSEAQELAEPLAEEGVRLVPSQERIWWAEVGKTWSRLERLVDEGLTIDAEVGEEILERIELVGGRVPRPHQWLLVPVVEALHKSTEFDLASRLLSHVDPAAGSDTSDRSYLRGLRALVETSLTGQEAPDLRASAADLLAATDEALADEQRGEARIEDAADLVTLALELLFHRELHADQLTSPLVEDPDGFLRDWRASRVGRLLSGRDGTSPGPHPAAPARDGRDRGREQPHVVVSPGTFPQFAAPVVEALRARATVDELDLMNRTELRYLGVSRFVVSKRLREALGLPRVPDLELLTRLERADGILLDWADRGAVEVLMTAPAEVPVTLRVHSMDALSAWVHLLDWSRVRTLVVVSEHMRVLMERMLGEPLARTTVQVVPNVIEADRFSTVKHDGHRRRLLMTGWAQRVKDPLWALEVLAILRQDDPTWRLTFLGADFLRHKATSTERYLSTFVERLVQDDVRDAVDFVGWTDDIGPHLADAGFILSLSRRESFGLGLMEGAASGAVPVVRDWPVYASIGGARSVAPDSWVVGSIEEAVRRIRDHADEPAWSEESARARDEVLRRYSGEQTLQTLVGLVLDGPRG